MTRFAVGDIQGCHDELRALLRRIDFRPDRDRLWFVGDLVNRGPQSLQTLRYVRSLGDSAVAVLGNHDLHLLARAFGPNVASRPGDTFEDVLTAPDRDALLEWLLHRPLAHYDASHGDLLIHAGVIPQWDVGTIMRLADEVQAALRADPRGLFAGMYGNLPERWSDQLTGPDRLRFTINTLTRIRLCTADGRIDLKMKGPPQQARPPWRPWFEFDGRRSREARVIFGHWSALGYVNAHGVVALDTGCVWGGSLTAYDLDAQRPPVSLPCSGYRAVE